MIRKTLGRSQKLAGPGEITVEQCTVRLYKRMQFSDMTITESIGEQQTHRVLVVDHTMQRHVPERRGKRPVAHARGAEGVRGPRRLPRRGQRCES